MTFKVLQCHEDLHKLCMVLHRCVVVPCSLTATWYNSDLQPNSGTYFPDAQVEGGETNKTVPSHHQDTVDPPDITITEGEGTRHTLSILFPRRVDMD